MTVETAPDATHPMPNATPPQQQEMPLAMVLGQPVLQIPQDLYIPPDALEVILDAFEGPLDLLLYLIRRQNLDILDIPVAEITRQYVTYIQAMHEMRFELAAEYLVMAAILAEIKSRMLLPRAEMEEGTEAEIPQREFGLVVGEPAEFRFLTSTVRRNDPLGSLVEDWGDEIEELSPLEVSLVLEGQEDRVVPERLVSRVTEVGTLELWCVSRDGASRWKLELNIRERRPEAA
jgi:hypothetical protein